MDLHGYHPTEIVQTDVLKKIIQQTWEMGENHVTLIHGHGRNRGISPGFVNTNTGYFGLEIRRALRRGVRPWLKPWNAEHAAGRITRPLRGNGIPYQGINVLMLWSAAMDKGYTSSTWMAELYRLTGLVKLTQAEPDMEGAEAAFLKAIETARQQEARLQELRAVTELARLGRRNATSRDRRMMLEPILDVIEGGEETREVRDARALLLELA
jgi:N-terminal domain of anti-restriction factor ArdC/Smr domain